MFYNNNQGNRDVDEVVLDMEGGPFQEYFFISVPVDANGKSRQFVYVHEDSTKQFPMFLGAEVSAMSLTQIDR